MNLLCWNKVLTLESMLNWDRMQNVISMLSWNRMQNVISMLSWNRTQYVISMLSWDRVQNITSMLNQSSNAEYNINAKSGFECRKDHICWIECLIQKITGVDATYVSHQESHRSDWKWIGSATPVVPEGVDKLYRDFGFESKICFFEISPVPDHPNEYFTVYSKKDKQRSQCTLRTTRDLQYFDG